MKVILKQDSIGKRAGVESQRVDTSRMASLHAQRSILHHHCFTGLHTRLVQSDEIGFGIGLAVTHVEGGDHEVCMEAARESMFQPLEQAALPAARHKDDAKPSRAYII